MAIAPNLRQKGKESVARLQIITGAISIGLVHHALGFEPPSDALAPWLHTASFWFLAVVAAASFVISTLGGFLGWTEERTVDVLGNVWWSLLSLSFKLAGLGLLFVLIYFAAEWTKTPWWAVVIIVLLAAIVLQLRRQRQPPTSTSR